LGLGIIERGSHIATPIPENGRGEASGPRVIHRDACVMRWHKAIHERFALCPHAVLSHDDQERREMMWVFRARHHEAPPAATPLPM
jgi:hypothetical protein